MSVDAAPDVSNRSSRPSFWRRYWAELCLILAIAVAAAPILFQHRIFGRDIAVTPTADLSHYALNAYSDKVNQGQSIMRSARPLEWTCGIRPGFSGPYCGYEFVLDRYGAIPGTDLTNLESIALTLDYQGPPTTVRFNLKNEDPRYSKHGDRSTTKVNKAEISIQPGRNTIILHPQDFSVAEWWLNLHKLTPELGRTQFNNIVSVELMTGTAAPAGDYSFSLKSMRLVRSTVAPAQLYLAMLGFLALSMFLYALLRVRRAREESDERERLETLARAALADAKHAAERASEAKSDFLAHMSHELRTPLNAVLGYAQLLERAPLAEKELNAVRVIRRSGNHVLTLITDILDIAKIEAGKMELRRAPCELRAMVGGVVEMVRPVAEAKGLDLSGTVADEVPNGIEADDKRLRQVLLNLMGNAAKFTTSGRVSLMVSQLARGADSVTLRFEVQDSGPGIAEDDIGRIFRPFEQVGNLERRDGGTGLGLAITRIILGLMQSDIQVQSRVGQGSSFWFDVSFALAEAQTGEGSIDAADIAGYAGARRRVLIADDAKDNRDLLSAFLGQLGFECSEAHNGVEALQVAQRIKPDLVLMDLKMPVMDGYEATRLMRIIEPLANVPIIVLSANIAEESAAVALAAGANGFLSKPIDNSELLVAIARCCDVEWTRAPQQEAA